MRRALLLAPLLLAACTNYGDQSTNSASVTYIAPLDNREATETQAAEHCAQYGRVPRLGNLTQFPNNSVFIYDCRLRPGVRPY